MSRQQIATSGLADRAATNVKLATDTARANLLTNGGFEIWQRGNGPFTNTGGTITFSADRWGATGTGATTVSVSKDTSNQDAASAACAVVTVTGYAAESFLNQRLEDFSQLRGKVVTAAVRVRTSTPNAVRLAIYNGTGLVYGAYHSGGGAYETLTVSTTIVSNASLMQLNMVFNANCTVYIDNAMLVVGSVPADYAPLHPVDDLARCLRYYESRAVRNAGYGAAGSQLEWWQTFQVHKAVSPTMTLSNNTPTNMTAANATFTINSGTDLYGSVSATGVGILSVQMTAEATP